MSILKIQEELGIRTVWEGVKNPVKPIDEEILQSTNQILREGENMTEEQFGRIIDDAVKGGAKKNEDSIEFEMQCKGVRIFTRLLSIVALPVLITGVGKLRAKGYTVAAKMCLITGLIALIFEAIRSIAFKRSYILVPKKY